jgi:hypothetical protein
LLVRFCGCAQITIDKQFKEGGVYFESQLMLSGFAVYSQLAVLLLGLWQYINYRKTWQRKAAHLTVAKKQSENKRKDPRTRYTFQRHAPSDPLPLKRYHLLIMHSATLIKLSHLDPGIS